MFDCDSLFQTTIQQVLAKPTCKETVGISSDSVDVVLSILVAFALKWARSTDFVVADTGNAR